MKDEYEVCIEWDCMPITVKHNLIVNKKAEKFSVLNEELSKFNGEYRGERLFFKTAAAYTWFVLRWS